MRKIIYSMFIISLLFVWSILLVSCDAITAQNINIDSAGGMNGGPGLKGAPGENGGPAMNGKSGSKDGNKGRNGGPGMNGNPGLNGNTTDNGNFIGRRMNADLIGKIISVDENSIKIELMEQTQNDEISNSNDKRQDANSNQNNDTKQSQKGFLDGMLELKDTGVEETLTVNDDASISEGFSMGDSNGDDDSKLVIKASDLKKDQVIMIWYKENTEIIEKINVVQS